MLGRMRVGLMTVMFAVPGALAASAPTALGADPVIAAVGDLGCGPDDPDYNNGAGTATDCRQRYVSDLLVAASPAAVLLPGDTQYDSGQLENYNAVFDPTYGRLNSVTYPVPGNVEYGDGTNAAQGFYTYFAQKGVLARIASSGNGTHVNEGYYSFDIGNWHIIGLNSNCDYQGVGGCGPGSTQEAWLKADLAANARGKCILAYAHHARWNSGSLGGDASTATFWSDLYAARADLFLYGHANHHYERHAPQDPAGNPNANGIREFIVSTGGEHHGIPPDTPGKTDTLERTNYTRFGILKLALHPTSYDWQFVPDSEGGNFTDSGTGTCHTTAPPTSRPPGGAATGSKTPAAGDRVATELSVRRVRVARSRRMLELDGTVGGRATGKVSVHLSAAGRRTIANAPIRKRAFRVRAKLPRAQAAAGGGMLTIRYRGNDQTRPLKVRLRAATAPARLRLGRPRISNGRLKASGRIAARAGGVVRVKLELVHHGEVRTLRFSAKVKHGAWKLDRKLSPAAISQIAQRSGTVHSYTLYAGSRSRAISGELRSFEVLGANG